MAGVPQGWADRVKKQTASADDKPSRQADEPAPKPKPKKSTKKSTGS